MSYLERVQPAHLQQHRLLDRLLQHPLYRALCPSLRSREVVDIGPPVVDKYLIDHNPALRSREVVGSGPPVVDKCLVDRNPES